MEGFKDASVLVTGGAGFVGSNLTKKLLEAKVRKVHIVDNLLSAERMNIPADDRELFSQASITDDLFLQGLKDEYFYVFHLATFHGNQNSIQSSLTNASCRIIDDSFQSLFITQVDQQPQISQGILYFLSLIKRQPPVNLILDIFFSQRILNGP